MGLNDLLARVAVVHPHVLVAGVPGSPGLRFELEAAVEKVGGVLAVTPADADVLAVCGTPGPELAAAFDVVWDQLPGPRARLQLTAPGQAAGRLGEALGFLAEDHLQRDAARHRPDAWDDAHGRPSIAVRDTPDEGSASHDGGDGGSDDGMEMPGGLMMAERGPDRDGLALDVLHVELGPVLSCWPAGLVIDLTLQGDVVQAADGRFLEAADRPAADQGAGDCGTALRAALALDRMADLLALTGRDRFARAARRLRHQAVAKPRAPGLRPRIAQFGERLARSRMLRRELVGLAPQGGRDAWARLLEWSRTAVAASEADDLPRAGRAEPSRDSAVEPAGPAEPAAVLDGALAAIIGREFATARLVLASFPLDAGTVVRRGARA